VSLLLDTSWGISILTLLGCVLAVAATTLAATVVLAFVVETVRLLGRLRRP
jgi:hypothetical protein